MIFNESKFSQIISLEYKSTLVKIFHEKGTNTTKHTVTFDRQKYF